MNKKNYNKVRNNKHSWSAQLTLPFILHTIAFFLFLYVFSSDGWGNVSTEIRSFAAAGKKTQTVEQKKKATKGCSQHCAGCGGFCGDGENETCNALAAERCGEKPCYAAGPDGKSYICTQVPGINAPIEKPVNSAPASSCTGETSKCSCDPNPVCNTVLRDRYHSSCPEYCSAFSNTTPTKTSEVAATPNSKSEKDTVSVHTTLTPQHDATTGNTQHSSVALRSDKTGERCSTSKNDCGDGLSCLATPYGYYCGVADLAYKSVKNGDECGSVVQCSNACTSGFYRTPAGDFFCGTPRVSTTVAPISPRVTLLHTTIAAIQVSKTTTPTVAKKSPTITRVITTTVPQLPRNDCNNPVLEYAAVGGHGGDILPSTYAPKDLISATAVKNAYVVNSSTKISAAAVEPLTEYATYVRSKGYTMVINSEGGYRSYQTQQQLHDDFYKTHSMEEYPNGSGAPVPGGHSQHQTGLAVDIGFLDENGKRAPNSNPDIAKIVQTAPDFGIVQPVAGDTAHFYVLEPVIEKEKWNPQYRPIAKNASDMDSLNAMIRQYKKECGK